VIGYNRAFADRHYDKRHVGLYAVKQYVTPKPRGQPEAWPHFLIVYVPILALISYV